MKARAIVFSDVHLESPDSKPEEMLKVLYFYPGVQIVIAGDLQDHEGQSMPPESGMNLLMFLRQERHRVTYVSGNHDPLVNSAITQYIGVQAVGKCVLEIAERKLCIMHGHQFDRFWFICKARFVDKIFLALMRAIQVVDRKKTHIASWTDSFHRFLASKCAKQAARFAKKRKYDAIICGHTHIPMHQIFYFLNGRKVEYFNSGSWIANPSSFVEISEDGRAKLCIVHF